MPDLIDYSLDTINQLSISLLIEIANSRSHLHTLETVALATRVLKTRNYIKGDSK